jgi:hypothetical protein
MPFQTYDVLSGREFTHGLTREAPVSFNLRLPAAPDRDSTYATTMWAVGFFNATAGYTLGRVWGADGRATPPTDNISFDEGAVVGKLLFNTLSSAELPVLENMPAWDANISEPTFCRCTEPGGPCDMVEQSRQCTRSTSEWDAVSLLQFDVAIKDSRAPGTQWVFGTFVADGQRKASEPNPWNRISPLGLMFGNDTPPEGGHADAYPDDPRENGFAEEVIFWDTVDMLNAAGGSILAMRPGHLGCNSRLNGPADNANSSCLSCHMTASVPDTANHTPPIIAQFQPAPGITSECVAPSPGNPSVGTDASGARATVRGGVSFSQMDGIFFANTGAGVPVNMTVDLPSGPTNILGDWPQYADGRSQWISLDYSLQLSISLAQWGEWQADEANQTAPMERLMDAVLPGR